MRAKVPKCGTQQHPHAHFSFEVGSETFRVNSDVSSCLMNEEQAAVDQVCVCEGLQMIIQSFISSNSVSFRSCTSRLHKNRIRSCELPQPIDPAPQSWIALLWGSPASQTGFNHALSPNHGNLIYLKPLAVLLEPLYSLFWAFSVSHLIRITHSLANLRTCCGTIPSISAAI